MATMLEQPEVVTAGLVPDPMLPMPYRIQRVRQETDDTFTLEILPEDSREGFSFAPGQFNMLYVFGVGEVPISISSDPDDAPLLKHTTRVVGTVTKAMRRLKRGDIMGIRGPFGTHWPVEEAAGRDVVIVAGGIGLAPLRPALYRLMAEREKYRKIVLLVWHAHARGHAVPPRTGTVARQVRPGNPGHGRSCGQQLARQRRRGDDDDPACSLRSFQHLGDGLRA